MRSQRNAFTPQQADFMPARTKSLAAKSGPKFPIAYRVFLHKSSRQYQAFVRLCGPRAAQLGHCAQIGPAFWNLFTRRAFSFSRNSASPVLPTGAVTLDRRVRERSRLPGNISKRFLFAFSNRALSGHFCRRANRPFGCPPEFGFVGAAAALTPRRRHQNPGSPGSGPAAGLHIRKRQPVARIHAACGIIAR